jgi:hypothetical protein
LFDKTDPINRVFYTPKRWGVDEGRFEAAVVYIRENGSYAISEEDLLVYELEGWRYWTTGLPVKRVKLIKRAKV